LQRAQCRYAVELARARAAHGAPGADPVVTGARRSVLEARHRLAQLGIDQALPGTHKHRRWLWWALAAVLVVLLLMSAFRALGGS
jgi:hypothetical protein